MYVYSHTCMHMLQTCWDGDEVHKSRGAHGGSGWVQSSDGRWIPIHDDDDDYGETAGVA
jgi:hypothetical protein